MEIEREKELFSQIEALRSQLEGEYDFKKQLDEFLYDRLSKLNTERQIEQDKPKNNWNWVNIENTQSAIDEIEDVIAFRERFV